MNNDKVRPCLKCNKEFLSKGSWNRLCPTCNKENERELKVPVRPSPEPEEEKP
jgi:hypothetical protein